MLTNLGACCTDCPHTQPRPCRKFQMYKVPKSKCDFMRRQRKGKKTFSQECTSSFSWSWHKKEKTLIFDRSWKMGCRSSSLHHCCCKINHENIRLFNLVIRLFVLIIIPLIFLKSTHNPLTTIRCWTINKICFNSEYGTIYKTKLKL